MNAIIAGILGAIFGAAIGISVAVVRNDREWKKVIRQMQTNFEEELERVNEEWVEFINTLNSKSEDEEDQK